MTYTVEYLAGYAYARTTFRRVVNARPRLVSAGALTYSVRDTFVSESNEIISGCDRLPYPTKVQKSRWVSGYRAWVREYHKEWTALI